MTHGTLLYKSINHENYERMAPDNGFVASELHRLKAQKANSRPTRAITAQIEANGLETYEQIDQERPIA